MSSIVKSWGPLLVIACVGAACHAKAPATSPNQTAPPATVPARPAPPPPPAAAAAPPPAAPLSEDELFRRKSLAELNAERPLGDVFFDYDQSTLRDEGKQVLERDAQWLAKWPQTTVRIDGHCDERGTAEYNLALGERRAAVLREYLATLGVRSDRIETRSLGKEAPFCQESAEACWSQNRRGHFVFTGK
jgi:peptidoglycan-associated lipoprotein